MQQFDPYTVSFYDPDTTELEPATLVGCDRRGCARTYRAGSECSAHGKFGRIRQQIDRLKQRRDLWLRLHVETGEAQYFELHVAAGKQLALWLRAAAMAERRIYRTARRFCELCHGLVSEAEWRGKYVSPVHLQCAADASRDG
jgi:hypothetical protein